MNIQIRKSKSRLSLTSAKSVLLFLGFLAEPLYGANLGQVLRSLIDLSYQSRKSIYDVERCIVLLDTTGIPSVYRQPDRPGKTLIAYSLGTGVPYALELTTTETGTRIDVRAQRIGVLKRFPPSLETCL